jgi:hypothetical protein
MTITHTWGIKGVDYDSSTNKVLRLHWTLESYDGESGGEDAKNSYGTVPVRTPTVLPPASITAQAGLNLLYQELGLNKDELEQVHGMSITKEAKDTTKTKVPTDSPTNANVLDVTDYTTVTTVVQLLNPPLATFQVRVKKKTEAHPKYGTGSENGYVVDGVEGKTLSLLPGRSYRFDQSDATNSGHPLRIYKGASKTGTYLLGVTSYGTPGLLGAFTQIDVPAADAHTPLYYQCSAHAYMGGQLNITIAAASSEGTAQSGNSGGGGSSGY